MSNDLPPLAEFASLFVLFSALFFVSVAIVFLFKDFFDIMLKSQI